jgi:hypothetical protein
MGTCGRGSNCRIFTEAFEVRDPEGQFKRNYNRCSFAFSHELRGNPLFDLQHLIDYSRRLPDDPQLAYWSNGAVSVSDRWETPDAPRPSLQNTIAYIADNNSLLIASPRRITSYHIDADTNFLFQIAGDKSISVFNQADRLLISDRELESYYAGDINRASFKQSRQQEGKTYELEARIYKLNHRLRRYGLKPTPPGVSLWRDRVKLASAKGLAATRSLLRR